MATRSLNCRDHFGRRALQADFEVSEQGFEAEIEGFELADAGFQLAATRALGNGLGDRRLDAAKMKKDPRALKLNSNRVNGYSDSLESLRSAAYRRTRA